MKRAQPPTVRYYGKFLMKIRSGYICLLCALFLTAALGAQTSATKTTPAAAPATVAKPAAAATTTGTAKTTGTTTTKSTAATTATTTAAATSPTAVPSSYRNVSLGSSMDGVKQALLADPLFGYRGERDVSMLSGENRTLIETFGTAFITRAWFQFSDDKLYIMTFNLDAEKVDYYSIYSHLVEKYGEPGSMDPRKSIWTDGKTTMSLERPLTLKYVDDEIFAKLLEKDTTVKASSDITRESFINDF